MIRASAIDHSYSSSEVLCLALPSTPQSAANSAAAADVEYWLQPRVVLRADERRVGAGFGTVAAGVALLKMLRMEKLRRLGHGRCCWLLAAGVTLLERDGLRHRSEDANKDGEAPTAMPRPAGVRVDVIELADLRGLGAG